IDETFARFKSVVQEGRRQAYDANKLNKDKGAELVKNWTDFADGRIFSGEQAFKYGFVDELGDFDAAVERARKLAGIPDANLIRYEQTFDMTDLLGWFVKTETPSLKVDFGMDLPKLQAGRLYFLLPTVVR
ncbi:MAG: S49 family peptidase, partial [Limisphaerales bacterium]